MTNQITNPQNTSVITVSVHELKEHLSTYLRQVKAGKIIEITEHGKPVGRIFPQEQSVEEKLAAMQQAGLIDWSGEKFDPGEFVGETMGPKSLSDILSEIRE